MQKMSHHHHHQLLEEKTSRESNPNIMVSSSSSSFCYSDVPHHLGVTHLQNFDPNPEIYNLASGIEMIGFQPKPQNSTTHDDHNHTLMVPSHDDHQHVHHHQQEMGFMDDDSSIRPCVFPCEGNERPSQGLSLSLSSSNPSTISLQSFELRHHHNQNHQRFNLSSISSNSREGYLGKAHSFHHQEQQQQQQQDLFGKSIMGCGGSTSSSSMSLQFELMRNSKYMGPAQELLYEFCNLGTQLNPNDPQGKKSQLRKNKEQWELQGLEDDDLHANNNNNASSSSSSINNASLYGISLLDLQKRKTKLLGLLEELDRRYKHYCEQMKGVVSSFETVLGPGSADVYSSLASKAMSRHFRCLRDAIVAQIKATKKAMGDKDSSNVTILGTTKGETPRLRILDQNLRQQRAYQQMTMMEAHPWRPQRGLPERSVSILRAWLFEHFLHPYPSDVDKHILARQTGLSRSQVSNWFINARVRLWKPMVEQMYLEETREEEQENNNMGSSSDNATDTQPSTDHHHHHGGGYTHQLQDPKPDPDQLLRFDPDSLSSIVNTTGTAPASTSRGGAGGQFIGGRVIDGFGSMDHHLDFPSSSSYNQQHHAGGNYEGTTQNDHNAPQIGFGGGKNVSLTLGLQQHDGNNNGVSLAFSPTSQANSLFYPRQHMEDCQQVHQYNNTLLDGEQGQNLPYRNLMGAQVLHDFA